tara:strand:+ start:1392 stop:1706 length:315 start_codon:yes stop_codon:yes gene_type:complete
MIIVNPTVTDHFIKVVPRFYPTTEVTFNISDSLNNTNDTVTAIYLRDTDDKLKLTFTYTFKEKYTYKMSLIDSNEEVVFMGMLFATTELPEHTMTPFTYTSWKQ